MDINQALSVLQLSRPVTHQEIRKAYRNLALKHHPDISGGDAITFIQMERAYRFLLEKTASEINNIQHFRLSTRKLKGPLIIPDSPLFGDAENLFYIYHAIKNVPVIRAVFKVIRFLLFLPTNAAKSLRLAQLLLGLTITLCLLPFLLAALMLLSMPYLLYECCFEGARRIFQNFTGRKLTKYSHAMAERCLFLTIRCLPAIAIIGLVGKQLLNLHKWYQHPLLDFFSMTLAGILFVWIMSLGRDVYISLNQKA